ncbi:MAG: UvrB/UvrC motif-containing protein [Verrucomicrobiota bacterium]
MLCHVCKQNEAKVHLTEMHGGVTKKLDLCEACSKAKGIDDPTAYSLADLLLGLSGNAPEAAAETEDTQELKCPQCGFTQSDFKKSGRLGCAQCYQTFAEGLQGLLKQMHKGTKHVGKVPSGHTHSRGECSAKLTALQKKLDKAVASEDFEQAAVLRDEIKKLKAHIEKSETV